RITHSNIENSKVIKMKMFKKVKSLILNLTGIKRSIVYVEDGCEGLFFIKKSNEIIYSNYFLGRVPEEIREISDLLITLCLK
ncbi:MAG: hypothetical protein RMJ53_10980, partial [Chitinophagales bacterium]|nr:hypothetical protein [Chitinophagales bacterium]